MRELTGAGSPDADDGAAPLLFRALGITIEPDSAAIDAMIAGPRIVGSEPERLHHVRGSLSAEYLRGFADAAAFLHTQAVDAVRAERRDEQVRWAGHREADP